MYSYRIRRSKIGLFLYNNNSLHLVTKIKLMQEIINLLGAGKLSEAIERSLLVFQNEPNKYKVCVIFKTRYHNLLEEEYKGIITQETNRVERTRLSSNLLEFIIQVQSGNFDDNNDNEIDNLNQIVDCSIPQVFNSSENSSNNLILNPPRQINTNEDFVFDANITLIKGNFESENFNNSYKKFKKNVLGLGLGS